jgi:hypothetical protein
VVPESEQSLVRTSIVNGYSQNKFNGGVIPVGFTPVIKRYDDEKRPVSGGGGVTALGFEDSVWREHIDDLDNPHRVTAAQVGNTEAVWNANKLQGYDIAMDAPANGQFLQWHSDTQEWTASSIPTFISEDTDTDLVGYVQGDGSNVFATTTIPNTDITGLGTASTKNTAFFLQSANNLNDVASASASRNNLGLGTAAVKDTTFFLQAANNLNDLGSSDSRPKQPRIGRGSNQGRYVLPASRQQPERPRQCVSRPEQPRIGRLGYDGCGRLPTARQQSQRTNQHNNRPK